METIRIIAGAYAYRENGKTRFVYKGSSPIAVADTEARRLIRLGVAQLAECAENLPEEKRVKEQDNGNTADGARKRQRAKKTVEDADGEQPALSVGLPSGAV